MKYFVKFRTSNIKHVHWIIVLSAVIAYLFGFSALANERLAIDASPALINKIIDSRTNHANLIITVNDEQGTEFTLPETQTSVEIVATLSEVQTTDVSFEYRLNGLETTAERFKDFQLQIPDDFGQQLTGAVVTIPAGELKGSFFVDILHDIYDEDDETVSFFLSNAKGATLAQNSIKFTITDDETTPVLILSAPDFTRDSDGNIYAAIDESKSGIELKLEIVDQFNLSSRDITVGYQIDQAEGVDADEQDYIDPGESTSPNIPGQLVVFAEAEEREFTFFIFDNLIKENQETIVFTLTSADNAIIHETFRSITITINDDDGNVGAINDTGVTTCYNADQQQIICDSSTGFPATDQDGSPPHIENRFQKLDSFGNRISSTSANAACIYDENTNLVWEVKKDANEYSWLNTISSVNGGNEGFEGAENASGSNCPCNTEQYAEALNTVENDDGGDGLCNITGWRLPKLREMVSIMNFEPTNDEVLINGQYFNISVSRDIPGTRSVFYWTSTPVAVTSDLAWCVFFGKQRNGHIRQCDKTNDSLPVRMVATCSPNTSFPDRPC